MSKELVVVLGGARAGKSDFAQELAQSGDRALFVATAEARDDDMARRIADHRARRPLGWDTLEEPVHLVDAIAPVVERYDMALLDCLTLWVSNHMLIDEGAPEVESRILDATERLLQLYEGGSAGWVVVSNEVGMGVVPPTPSGRDFRDILGRVNRMVASRADRVYLMVAGLALELKGAGARTDGEPGPEL